MNRKRRFLQAALVDHKRFRRRRLLAVLRWAGALLALAAGVYAWLRL